MKVSVAFIACVALVTPAAAQEAYPTRPITLIVPFAAGATSDVIARLAAQQMVQSLGQSDVTLVRDRGAVPALNDAIGGEVDGVCGAAASVTGAIQGGRLRGLVISSPKRLRTLPEVPTSAEAGLPDFQQQGWNGLFAPKGTPDAIIARLNAALRAAVASDALQARMDDLGSIPATGERLSPGSVPKLVPAEIDTVRTLLAKNK